jgi:hypothetical protein
MMNTSAVVGVAVHVAAKDSKALEQAEEVFVEPNEEERVGERPVLMDVGVDVAMAALQQQADSWCRHRLVLR